VNFLYTLSLSSFPILSLYSIVSQYCACTVDLRLRIPVKGSRCGFHTLQGIQGGLEFSLTCF
jgi:hypothetical protein